MGFLSVISLVIFSVFVPSLTNGDLYKSERELRKDIFTNYDKLVRPVKRASTAVTVKISMKPLSLKSMNENDQVIVMDTYVILTWVDEYLQWDPREYDNITDLRIPSSTIWKPDIALYTGTPDTSLFPTVETPAIIFNSGKIMWAPPFTISSRCPIPFRNYGSVSRTFVECNLRLGSYTHSGKLLDLQLSTDKVDLTDFLDNNHEWKLVKVISNRESKLYPCCVDEYPLVNFNVTLKKRNYYINDS